MTILILHGWGQNKNVWNDFISKFDGVSVIALDLPGFGDEPLISNEWGVPEYADWVESKISELKLNNVILLGHSFGGRISSYLASKRPVWLKALILTASPSIYRPSLSTKLKIRKYKILKWVAKMLGREYRKQQTGNSELANADSEGLGKIFRKVVPFDQTEELKMINVPTLLLWGEKDDAVPLSIAREMNELIKSGNSYQTNLEIITDSGHQVVQESPFLSYGIIKKFIESL